MLTPSRVTDPEDACSQPLYSYGPSLPNNMKSYSLRPVCSRKPPGSRMENRTQTCTTLQISLLFSQHPTLPQAQQVLSYSLPTVLIPLRLRAHFNKNWESTARGLKGMCQGYEVCRLLIHSRQQLRCRVGKYEWEMKMRGREGRIGTKRYEKKNNSEERDEKQMRILWNLTVYHWFGMRQSNWGNEQWNKEREYAINILLH